MRKNIYDKFFAISLKNYLLILTYKVFKHLMKNILIMIINQFCHKYYIKIQEKFIHNLSKFFMDNV
jgi:hypothetical protein